MARFPIILLHHLPSHSQIFFFLETSGSDTASCPDRYRRKRDKLVERASVARLPLEWGNFQAYCYRSLLDGMEHIAMVKVSIFFIKKSRISKDFNLNPDGFWMLRALIDDDDDDDDDRETSEMGRISW